MKTNHAQIDTIVNDVVSEGFDEIDDLCRFIQNRLGKVDNQKAMAFWVGREHMIKDRKTLQTYVKSEVEN